MDCNVLGEALISTLCDFDEGGHRDGVVNCTNIHSRKDFKHKAFGTMVSHVGDCESVIDKVLWSHVW